MAWVEIPWWDGETLVRTSRSVRWSGSSVVPVTSNRELGVRVSDVKREKFGLESEAWIGIKTARP